MFDKFRLVILSYLKCQLILLLPPKQLRFQAPKQATSLLSCFLCLKNTLLLDKYHQVHEDVNLHICVYAETQLPHLTISKLSNPLSTESNIFGSNFKMPLNCSLTGFVSITQSHYSLLARVRKQLFLNKIKLKNAEVSFGNREEINN